MEVKLILKKLFKWNPQRISIIGFTIGIIIVLLSIAMIYVRGNIFVSMIIRDIVMILLFGIAIPLFIIRKIINFRSPFGLIKALFYVAWPGSGNLGYSMKVV